MSDKGYLDNKSKQGDGGFKVPDGYFEGLTDRVMDQVKDVDPIKNTTVIAMLKRHWPAAAAAVLLFCLGLTSILIPSNNKADVFASISNDAAYDYVYDNLDAYSTADLSQLFVDGYDAQDLDMLESDDLNFAIDEILDEIDPEELIELF